MAKGKVVESREEKIRTYPDMIEDLGGHFLKDQKRFIFGLNRVSEMLDGSQFRKLQALCRGEKIETTGVFEDKFEEICGEMTPEAKRELVRMALRHM